MKHLMTFENYNNNPSSNEDIIRSAVNDTTFISVDDVIETFKDIDVRSFLKEFEMTTGDDDNNRIITNGYRILKRFNKKYNGEDEIYLDRVVFLRDIKELNKDSLGIYWSDHFVDDHLIDTLKEEVPIKDLDEKEPYVITAIFNKQDIDLQTTMINKIIWEEEEEITVKKDSKPISYEIKKYK